MVTLTADRDAATAVCGRGGSPGRVVGRARVFDDPTEARSLRPGDIVIAKTASPRWAYWFESIAGFVAETGGTLSHAAVLARDCRIPAVLGATGATGAFRDGDRIEVDGRSGCVRRVH